MTIIRNDFYAGIFMICSVMSYLNGNVLLFIVYGILAIINGIVADGIYKEICKDKN